MDSARGDDDFTPFRNIMNEYYARDTSRKTVSYTHLDVYKRQEIKSRSDRSYTIHTFSRLESIITIIEI